MESFMINMEIFAGERETVEIFFLYKLVVIFGQEFTLYAHIVESQSIAIHIKYVMSFVFFQSIYFHEQ